MKTIEMTGFPRIEGGEVVMETLEVTLDDDLSVVVRQTTNYPSSGRVSIQVDPSKAAKFPLQLRIPAWCGKDKFVNIDRGIGFDKKIKSISNRRDGSRYSIIIAIVLGKVRRIAHFLTSPDVAGVVDRAPDEQVT